MELSRIPERKEEDINYSEIVTVARLEPQKNQELLIDAFNLVSKKHQDIVLKIYGEGSLKNKLQNKIHELGLKDKIFLMGAKQDVLEWIKESFCFILSSDFEGLPNSLIEAMCMGIQNLFSLFFPYLNSVTSVTHFSFGLDALKSLLRLFLAVLLL